MLENVSDIMTLSMKRLEGEILTLIEAVLSVEQQEATKSLARKFIGDARDNMWHYMNPNATLAK